jgi:hypothetical protein
LIIWSQDSITNILFGGCLIKLESAKDLGNISEAYVKDRQVTVQKAMAAFLAVKIMITGHGAYGGKELFMLFLGASDGMERSKSKRPVHPSACRDINPVKMNCS